MHSSKAVRALTLGLSLSLGLGALTASADSGATRSAEATARREPTLLDILMGLFQSPDSQDDETPSLRSDDPGDAGEVASDGSQHGTGGNGSD